MGHFQKTRHDLRRVRFKAVRGYFGTNVSSGKVAKRVYPEFI